MELLLFSLTAVLETQLGGSYIIRGEIILLWVLTLGKFCVFFFFPRFIYLKGRVRKEERFSIGSLAQIATTAKIGPDGSRDLILGLLCGCRNPSSWTIFCCFPGASTGSSIDVEKLGVELHAYRIPALQIVALPSMP